MKLFRFFSSKRGGRETAPEKPSTKPAPGSRQEQKPGEVTTHAVVASRPAESLVDRPERSSPAATATEEAPSQAGVATATMVEDPPDSGSADPGREFDLDSSLDAALESANPAQPTAGEEVRAETDQEAVRELFADIAGNHAQPVKNFVA